MRAQGESATADPFMAHRDQPIGGGKNGDTERRTKPVRIAGPSSLDLGEFSPWNSALRIPDAGSAPGRGAGGRGGFPRAPAWNRSRLLRRRGLGIYLSPRITLEPRLNGAFAIDPVTCDSDAPSAVPTNCGYSPCPLRSQPRGRRWAWL